MLNLQANSHRNCAFKQAIRTSGVVMSQLSLPQKHSGRCLLRPVRADQSKTTRLFERGS